MCEGYAEQKQRDFQSDWERTRWMTFYLFNVQLQRKDRKKSLQALIRFPWEKTEAKHPHMTPEEFELLKQKWAN